MRSADFTNHPACFLLRFFEPQVYVLSQSFIIHVVDARSKFIVVAQGAEGEERAFNQKSCNRSAADEMRYLTDVSGSGRCGRLEVNRKKE